MDFNYKDIFETMDEGFACCKMIYDDAGMPIDFMFISVNPAFAKQTGTVGADVIGKRVGVLKPGAETHWIAMYKELVQNGNSKHFENTSTPFGMAYEVYAWRIGENHFGAIFTNITLAQRTHDRLQLINMELKKSKLALMNIMEDLEIAKATIEVEKAKDEAMLNCIGEGVIATDNDNNIIVMNNAAKAMLGWKTADVTGCKITQLALQTAGGKPLLLDNHLVPIAEPGREDETDPTHFFVRKDLTRFPTAVTVTPIKLGDQTIGTIEIFRDVTQERAVDKAKSEFISLASHQLRTPLGIVEWYLEALEAEQEIKNLPTQALGYITEIRKNNERTLNLVRNLLSVSRINQGEVKDKPAATDIIVLLKSIVHDVHIAAARKQINLKLAVHTIDPPPITIDGLRLREVIENLVTNAVEYNKATGTVTITVETDAHNLIVQVADTGVGISPVDQRQLFTKFYRTQTAKTSNTRGSGLGLYLVKSYAEAWGGTIAVKSTEHEGSTFTLTLPLAPINI